MNPQVRHAQRACEAAKARQAIARLGAVRSDRGGWEYHAEEVDQRYHVTDDDVMLLQTMLGDPEVCDPYGEWCACCGTAIQGSDD